MATVSAPALGQADLRERFEQHEAMSALGAVGTLHPKTRRASFLGVRLATELTDDCSDG